MTPMEEQAANAGAVHTAVGLITLLGVQKALMVTEAILAQVENLPVLPPEHPVAAETDRLRSIAHAAHEAMRKAADGPAIVLVAPGTRLPGAS